jgi:hypothetical protein
LYIRIVASARNILMIQIQKLLLFGQYSIVPLFYYYMCIEYHYNAIKSYLISNNCTISETFNYVWRHVETDENTWPQLRCHKL